MPTCPHCDAELTYEDSYGRFSGGIMVVKRGDIYRCPNHQGFSSFEDAKAYDESATLENWEDVCCESSVHYVSGSFYTDSNDNLHDGYPC